MIGGLLRVISSFIPVSEDPDLLQLLYVITDLGLVQGIVGVYLIERKSLSNSGHMGFAITLCALSFISGPEAEIYGVSAYEIGSLPIGLGILMFSIAQLQSGSGHKKGAYVLIGSIVVGVLSILFPSFPQLFVFSGFLFGIGFFINGAYAYAHSSKHGTSQQTRNFPFEKDWAVHGTAVSEEK